jgi:hypothetical protein
MDQKISSITKRLSLPGQGDVVLVDPVKSKDIDPGRNVFLLDTAGQVIWQIEAATLSHGIKGFSAVYLGLGNKLMAYSPNGIEYTIQSDTGRILGKELIR